MRVAARDLQVGDVFVRNHRIVRLYRSRWPDDQWGSRLAGYYIRLWMVDTESGKRSVFSTGANTRFVRTQVGT